MNVNEVVRERFIQHIDRALYLYGIDRDNIEVYRNSILDECRFGGAEITIHKTIDTTITEKLFLDNQKLSECLEQAIDEHMNENQSESTL